jgi:cyclic pyranopterin phosphate synthase
MPKLTHVDEEGRLSMVDVGKKEVTKREATAGATIHMAVKTLEELEAQSLPKGDVLATARLAGILAAKQTSSLIPLTHPLMITHVDVSFELDRKRSNLNVSATVRCEGKTGVEIEAMTACAVAALTVYDMCKSIDRGMTIDNLRLLRKSGGKSGTYMRPA